MLQKNMGQAHFGSTLPLAFGAEEEGGEGSDARQEASSSNSVDDILKNPEVQAKFQEMLENEVSGLKSKNADLINKFKRFKLEPEEVESLIENQKRFEGLDVERLVQLQKQVEENEEMKLLSEGKIEEVVEKRVNLLKKDHARQVEAITSKVSTLEQELARREENLRELKVDGTIQKAYGELDFEPAALDFVVKSAREVFIMDDDGKVSPRDSDGNIIFGKDGSTPIDAKGWLELQAEQKPFLRKASSGAGAMGGSGSATTRHGADSSIGQIASGLEKMMQGR